MRQNIGGFGGIPPVVKNLLIINVILSFATYVLASRFNIDLIQKLGLFYFKSEYFKPYQFVTHMFMHARIMHGGITHLFFNMFALWMFGRVLESVWGPKRFFVYYMATGLGAAALHILVNHIHITQIINAAEIYFDNPTPGGFEALIGNYFSGYLNDPNIRLLYEQWQFNPTNSAYVTRSFEYVEQLIKMQMDVPTVGASGAVYGVLLGFGMLFPNTRLMLLFPPIPIKAKYFVIAYGVIELYLGITQPGSNIAHFAHLGGMIFGFFLIKYWNKNNTNFY